MGLRVADTSALVSLGTVVGASPNPLDLLLASHTVVVPEQVVDELTETASYHDASGEATQAVLDRRSSFETRSIELDETSALVRNDAVLPDTADEFLAQITDARSWSSNSYVERAQSTLRQQRENEQPDPE